MPASERLVTLRRRAFLIASASWSVLPPIALAQATRRVGWLVGGSPTSHAKLLNAFRAGLREHGWIEGKNVVLEPRWAEGDLARLPTLAAELVRMKPDVIVTAANIVHLAVKKETSTIPVVMATGADPMAAGLVKGLARPGTNFTGITGFFEATPIKMLELAVPLAARGGRISVVLDGNYMNADFRARLKQELAHMARSADLGIEFHEAITAEDVWRVLDGLEKNRPSVLLVLPGSMIYAVSGALVKRAAPLKVPVIYPFEESTEAGGLMSYAAPLADSYRRAAYYVDRILKGAKPSELPIEQPTRLVLAVNLKTARELGIQLPEKLLLRADRVIEYCYPCIVSPPDTLIVCPVMKSASSLARNSTAPGMSSGLPSRPIGTARR